MNFIRSAFARRAAIVILAEFGAALPQLAVAQSNPLVGTWNLVPERSTFTPGPARYKSMTLTITDSAQTMINLDGLDGQGKPVKATYTAIPDGKPHPVTGMAAFDSASWTRNSDTNTSFTYLKGKAIVALGVRVLSADGKTLTFREQMYDRNGKQTSIAVMIFDNPNVQLASVAPSAAAGAGGVVMANKTTPDEDAGAAALEKGDADAAIATFTKVIDKKDKASNPFYDYVMRAVAYSKKGMNEPALADFDAALNIKSDDTDAHFRRAGVRVQLKQYQGAIEDLSAVIKADPENAANAAAYRLRAFAYITLGDDKNAGPDYDKACSLDKAFCL